MGDMPGPTLMLRRANVSRSSGTWQHDDFDVFDGDRKVGRIYVADRFHDYERWFWGVSFQLTGRKSYGDQAASLDEAKALFRAEYQTWKAGQCQQG
jgi:hypothetical protein